MTEPDASAVESPGHNTSSAPRMYLAVMGIGIACSLAIVLVYETTWPVIERNRIELRQQAIRHVLPATSESVAFRQNEMGHYEPCPADSTGSDLVFAGYDEGGHLVGLAIEAEAFGYQDVVRLLYGYSLESESIVGIRILESRETPGLGDRVETDEEFLRNFENLDVRLTPDGRQLLHPIEFVKPGEKQNRWQIDGITGATITSRAVADMLRDSTARRIPDIRLRQSDFIHAGRED